MKAAAAMSEKDKMGFMNYFDCRTQRVQLNVDTEAKGKKNFGDFNK